MADSTLPQPNDITQKLMKMHTFFTTKIITLNKFWTISESLNVLLLGMSEMSCSIVQDLKDGQFLLLKVKEK